MQLFFSLSVRLSSDGDEREGNDDDDNNGLMSQRQHQFSLLMGIISVSVCGFVLAHFKFMMVGSSRPRK